MESGKGKGSKKNVMTIKAWEIWQSVSLRAKKSKSIIPFSHSSSFSRNEPPLKQSEDDHHKPPKNKYRVAPRGYFTVYVGAEKQRFVMKTQLANHPLFKMLLEEAEVEYGYSNGGGPLFIPCHVDAFHEALAEMEQQRQCTLPPICGSFSFFSPSRPPTCGGRED